MVGTTNVKLLTDDGKRLDGRELDELRDIKIQPGVLNRVDGSAYIEWGKNKIMAAVYGPRECIPKHESDPYKAIVRCRYLMAPFSSLESHGKSGPNRRSMEISDVMREAFENVILVENYPRTEIDIFVEVLEGNGSTRCVGLTAAAVALVTAGLPIKDIPLALSVGKINGKIAIDMMKEEDNFGEADMAVGLRPGNKEIILLQMDGKLTRGELEQCFDMVYAAAEKVHAIQVNALKSMYEKKAEASSKGSDNGNNSRNSESATPITDSLAVATSIGAQFQVGAEAIELEEESEPENLEISADFEEAHEISREEEEIHEIGSDSGETEDI
ncbi:MAG: exosome complex exonuclease Rrp41 [Candidatus Micrarchaeia archaeon]